VTGSQVKRAGEGNQQEAIAIMAVPTLFRSGFPLATGGGDLWALSRTMDRLLEDLSRGSAGAVAQGFAPRLEVVERDGEYVVTAELPGVEEKDLNVEVHGNVLTIRGEKRSERSGESEGRAWSERVYGEFHRSIELPTDVQGDKAKASFKNGVLSITIPKSDASKVRSIPVTTS
jgi:HSP20 family protein